MPKMGWGLLGMEGGLKEWGLGGDKSWFTWGCAHKYEYGEHLAWNLGTLEVMGCTIIKQAKFSPDKWLKIPLIQIPPSIFWAPPHFYFYSWNWVGWLQSVSSAPEICFREQLFRTYFPTNQIRKIQRRTSNIQTLKLSRIVTNAFSTECSENMIELKILRRKRLFFFFAEIPRLMTSLNSPVESLLSFPYLCGTALDRNFKLLTSVEEDF